MTELENLYLDLLEVGFLVLRQAVDSKDPDWIEAEMEMLHNIPSLVGESNVLRHHYYWFGERTRYLERVLAREGNGEQASRIDTYYEPIWREMEPLLLEMFEQSHLSFEGEESPTSRPEI
ncbi:MULTISPECIES: hypothetical protein [unclassified Schlesneria]|uniref:hypothetical protein n=1 Tax=Schlesneria TaxID=656899 RepID=UPI0035A149D1